MAQGSLATTVSQTVPAGSFPFALERRQWTDERSAVTRAGEPVAVVASLRDPLFSDWHEAPHDAQQCAVTPQRATQAADRRAWRAQACWVAVLRPGLLLADEALSWRSAGRVLPATGCVLVASWLSSWLSSWRPSAARLAMPS